MNSRFGVTALAMVLTMAMTVSAAEQDTIARLDEALKAVATFEYGKDSGPLNLVEQTVVEAAKDPKQRDAVEQRLLNALGLAKTRDAKEFLCRQLRTIGTAHSVPQLEAMLTDPELSHMARYALGFMEDPAAAVALHRALGKTSGNLQVGILYTLGSRRYREALPDVAKLLGSPDAAMAAAAASALGNIGGAEAVKALETARPKAAEQLRRRIDDALMACADRLLTDGQKTEAARIYEFFYAPNQPQFMRIGALRGLVAVRGADAVPLLVEAIKSADPVLRASAGGFMGTMQGPKATETVAGLLPSLAPEAQALLLRGLGARGDAAATPAVVAATKSENENVRVAALEALGGIGNGSVVDLLVRAAGTSGGMEQQAARASLLRLGGDDVNGTILRALSSGDSKVRVELIRALAGRRASTAAGDLLKFAKDDDASVRREAIGALGTLASESDLAALVALAVRPKDAGDRPAVEQAIAAAGRRGVTPEKQAAPLLAALAGAPADAKPSLLRLLGKTATPSALEAIRAAFKDENAAVRETALRALSEWPNVAPAEDLLALARALTDPNQKAIALGGYIRMAGLSKNPTAMYMRAMELAERADDKKLVLAGLGAADSAEALNLVEQFLKDEQLQAEAALAAVQIADRMRQKDAARARAALQNVLAAVKDPRIRQKAQDIINEMEQLEGYILVWLGCGPYAEKGKEGGEIFDTAFPPEMPDAKDVNWKPITTGIGPWAIDLERTFGQLEYCAAYVRARIWSPAEQDARLEMGSDDAIKVWLNGKQVSAKYQNRGIAPRQDLVNVRLKEGWNDLLLKVVNHTGGWSFCCRVRKPDGSALDGLKVEAK